MNRRTTRGLWGRWAVTAVGAVLCVVVVGLATVSQPEWSTLHHLQIGIPILLAIGVAGFGGWLVHSGLSSDRILRIALWSGIGAILLGSFATWEMYTHMLEGEPFFETLHEPLLGMTEGAAVGAIIGYYEVRRREQHLEAEQAQQAISASMDGIALLNDEGEYEVMNQAHADVYGYDDPDAFLNEAWQICYTDEQAEHIEQEIMPQLYEEGSWRGELTGRRRDGRTFPQEITLSELPGGGLVCVVRDITERKQQENRLEALHGVTREFLTAETPDEITTELISVADDMLGYPLTTVWKYDNEADLLVPWTASEAAERFAGQTGSEGLPALEAASAEMEIFRGDEAVLIEDYQTLEGRQVADLPLGAVLFIPLGDYGMVSIGSPEPDAIDPTDRFLAEILVSNATAAIGRVERERELANREQRLRIIVENMPVILFAIDQNREITLQVGNGLDRLGMDQNEMVGTPISDAFGDSPEVIEAVDRSFDGEPVDITIDLWGRTYQVWYQPIENDDEVSNVIGVAMDVTDRQKREHGIRALHDATRRMMQAPDRESISQIAVDTAENALGLPISAIWWRADDNPRLEPAAWSEPAGELFGELPVFEPGKSISWKVYQEGEPRVYDDVSQERALLNPETEMRSELIVPIGDYGVLNSGSTEFGQFDETDVVLAQLLAANTRSALDRAEREVTLKQKTDQMEFFNSILRHDVLNGMTVIRGRAQFLTDELAGEQLQHAETIIDWTDDITTIIQRVRTVLDTLTGTGDQELRSVNLSEILRSEIERVRATYPEVEIDTEIPAGVTVQANELLGEVFGNVITNAVNHNETESLRIAVTVETDPDESDSPVVVRVADNGGGVPDKSKEAIFRRDETGEMTSTGSGFGLFFVDAMVTEYGGDVWVQDNVPEGAEFVFELPRSSQ